MFLFVHSFELCKSFFDDCLLQFSYSFSCDFSTVVLLLELGKVGWPLFVVEVAVEAELVRRSEPMEDFW